MGRDGQLRPQHRKLLARHPRIKVMNPSNTDKFDCVSTTGAVLAALDLAGIRDNLDRKLLTPKSPVRITGTDEWATIEQWFSDLDTGKPTPRKSWQHVLVPLATLLIGFLVGIWFQPSDSTAEATAPLSGPLEIIAREDSSPAVEALRATLEADSDYALFANWRNFQMTFSIWRSSQSSSIREHLLAAEKHIRLGESRQNAMLRRQEELRMLTNQVSQGTRLTYAETQKRIDAMSTIAGQFLSLQQSLDTAREHLRIALQIIEASEKSR